MNRMRIFLAILGLPLCAVAAGELAPDPAIIANRKRALIDAHRETPFPSPENRKLTAYDAYMARAAYALAVYHADDKERIPQADRYLKELQSNEAYVIPDDGSPSFPNLKPFMFPMPLMGRMAVDREILGRMSGEARAALQDILWRWLRTRSRIRDAAGQWTVARTENKDAIIEVTHLLSAQALMHAGPPYGPDRILADGHTLGEHYRAWVRYWIERFRQLAREGIHMEVNSPRYLSATISAYYALRDLGGDENDGLRQQADRLLTLHWADEANDFCRGATIRGGAGIRMYQTSYLTNGAHSMLRQWYYLYGWHDYDTGIAFEPGGLKTSPHTLLAAMSDYVPPAQVGAVATRVDKTPYGYTSRHWGKQEGRRYAFPSDIRRDSWWTPDYVLGSMTFSQTAGYHRHYATENRFAGVVFASGVNDRLIIQGTGKGSNAGGPLDWRGIVSAIGKDALVAAKDVSALENTGTRAFVAHALYRTKVLRDGWLFMQAGDGYVALRVATGGSAPHFTWSNRNLNGRVCAEGWYLIPNDGWSPVVLQCGRAAEHGSFLAFQEHVVRDTTFEWNTAAHPEALRYVSLKGDELMIWRQRPTLPELNGKAIDLNPARLYDSPYLQGTYGQDNMLLRFPGMRDLVLDFLPFGWVSAENTEKPVVPKVSGWQGTQFTVGAHAVTVRQLGRWIFPGNDRAHTLMLVRAADGRPVPGGRVVVETRGAVPGLFKYQDLDEPVTLEAGESYCLISEEHAGGDGWSPLQASTTASAFARLNARVWKTGAQSFETTVSANTCGAVDFKAW